MLINNVDPVGVSHRWLDKIKYYNKIVIYMPSGVYPRTPETREKIRLANLGTRKAWKGDKVGYHGLHAWVRRHLPKPELCQRCQNKPPEELANLTGEYNRYFDNWLYLYRKCHKWLDSGVRHGVKNEY